ncbi:Serum paraoxonase/arylesterase 2 [Candidatus Phaeomarinobacter ectocarpi]|uniref:Serum paraoxonase/arylesterase 2 n=2 Tax=Candidatus Phaeomarinibacter ectocarpi TaxID=1458461 RepID=X5MLE2_9HYPH|nr:Serum paraoxonase/arylesterase 2 [Candidatus Phaeomarinobacter ectocarpi]
MMMRKLYDSLVCLAHSSKDAHRAALCFLVVMLTAAPANSQNFPVSDYICRPVSVVDEAGQAVFGIEDMAHDVRNGRLILSAYDRFAAMRAMENGAEPPGGGLYAVDVDLLTWRRDEEGSVPVSTLDIRVPGDLLLHPHGIGLFDDGEASRLAVVNRLTDMHDASAADLLLFDVDGQSLAMVGRGSGDLFCRANDVALLDASTAVFTYDQSRCGAWGVWAERVFQPRSSGLRLSRFDGGNADAEPVLDDIAFANGVVISPDGASLLMTASRDQALRVFDKQALLDGNTDPKVVVSFEGGPDNVSIAPDGSSVTAVHPDPFALFLHINGWGDLPESSVVISSADGASQQTIVGPPGTMPGAATSAVMLGDQIIVSSAWDAGLGICSPHQPARTAVQQ